MVPNPQNRLARNLIPLVILLLFVLYCSVIYFKTSVIIGENKITLSNLGTSFVCNPDCVKVVHAMINKGVFDQLRAASVSLLFGLVASAYLLGPVSDFRRGIAIAMAICGTIVVASALLGEVQMGTRVLLIAIGVLGVVNAWYCSRGQTALGT